MRAFAVRTIGGWKTTFCSALCVARFGDQPWNSWPQEIVHRRSGNDYASCTRNCTNSWRWSASCSLPSSNNGAPCAPTAPQRGIRVIGDVAIFVSYDSADVWTHPEIFRLKEDLSPEVVAGCPPDAFSETGQRWGNPLYDWDALKSRGYNWWIKRMRWAIETCDIVRLDHFRGFEAYWEIPADEPTAVHGHWVQGPNEDLFKALRSALGDLPFIAEDLGYITRDVTELRKKLEIPGMKVMQFGFGDRGAHKYLPHRFERDAWCTPARTITTPPSAGGTPAPPQTRKNWHRHIWGSPTTECSGHSYEPHSLRSRILLSSRCKTSSVSAPTRE